MTTPAAKHRTPKTAQQRAQEALDVAERRVASLAERLAKLSGLIDAVQEDFDAAVTRRDFLAQNPDLPTPVDAPSTEQASTQTEIAHSQPVSNTQS